MKITIACKQFVQSGGAEVFLADFVRRLTADGHQVRVLAAKADDVPGVEVVRLRLPPVPRAFRDYVRAKASAKALADDDADLTFSDQKCWGAQVVRSDGGVQREYVKQRQKSYRGLFAGASNWVLRSLSIREWLRIRIDDTLYAEPGPRLVIVNSAMVGREVEQHYPHLRDRVRVIWNGADPVRFSPRLRDEHRATVRRELGIPEEALVGVFVGTGWRRKGLHVFAEALGVLARKGTPRPVRGIAVGGGNRRRMKSFARARGAGDVLSLIGPASPDRYYGAADLLVLPSFYDACATVTIEGLCCGLPVLTSIHNGAHELLTLGINGFAMSDAADAAQLAGFFEEFMDEGHLAEASRAARAAGELHTVERQYREILEAIRPVAGK